MKKILLTCFEPFGGEVINPSEEAVKNVSAPLGCDVMKLRLPVAWGKSQKTLFDAIDYFSPDVVLMTGQAGGSSAVRIERVAINLCGAIKDEDGLYPAGSEVATELPVMEGAPTAYFATFDCKKIQNALKEENIPAVLSYSAGTYICNYIMFSALDRFACENRKAKAGSFTCLMRTVRKAGCRRWGSTL